MLTRRDILKLGAVAPVALVHEPVRQRVLLLETVVAGFRYYDGERVWNSMEVGHELELRREPQNPYDERAIEVLWRGVKLGYIPKRDNSVPAQLMDRGEVLKAYVKEMRNTPKPWEKLHISVYLEV